MKSFFRLFLFLILLCTVISAEAQFWKLKKKQKDKKEEVPALSQSFLDSVQNNMIWVKGGHFIMGNSQGELDEKPEKKVTVDGFAMSKYLVTQAQWKTVMGNNPSAFAGCDECPVDKVSWNDAQAFIQKLNTATGKKYALPTEAEWEFAARGGQQTKHFRFSGSDNADVVAWHTGNSEGKPHPVGKKQPNELGLYDMSGNTWEWCKDYYHSAYYNQEEDNNPTGPVKGSGRVRRGGSWYTQAANCRISARSSVDPAFKDESGSFRLVQYPN